VQKDPVYLEMLQFFGQVAVQLLLCHCARVEGKIIVGERLQSVQQGKLSLKVTREGLHHSGGVLAPFREVHGKQNSFWGKHSDTSENV
jgi:hypothetical protein